MSFIDNLAERTAESRFCTILWKSVSNQQEPGRFFYFYGLIKGYFSVQKLLSVFSMQPVLLNRT